MQITYHVIGLVTVALHLGSVRGTCTTNDSLGKRPMPINARRNKLWPNDPSGEKNIDSLNTRFTDTKLNNAVFPTKIWPQLITELRCKFKVKKENLDQELPPSITWDPSGCMGLENLGPATIKSAQNGKYLKNCNECTFALQDNLAMAMRDEKDEPSRWQFFQRKGKCAIKNLHADAFLTPCVGCKFMVPYPLGAMFKSDLEELENEDLWVITRTRDDNYQLKSNSFGDSLLSLCSDCIPEDPNSSMAVLTPFRSGSSRWEIAAEGDNPRINH